MRNKRKHGEDQSLESMIHQAGSLGMTNNMEAKMTSILEALRCCASKNYMGWHYSFNCHRLYSVLHFTFDSILLRIELFRKVPSPAPGPAPETSPAPTPDASAPTANASSPTPMMSPPASPTSSPTGDPEDGPETDSENSTMAFDNLSSLNTDFLAFIECGLNTSKWKLAVQIASKQQKPVVEDKEIEMEDAEDWSVMDIDSSNKKNELTVVKYIDDIYAYYKKAKFNMTVPVTYVLMQRFLKASQSDKKLSLLLSALSVCPGSGTQPASNYDKNQILECSKLMVSFHQKAAVGKLTGVHRKYNTSKYDNAVRCEPTSFLLEAWF
ncbi:putative U-box domain-containing protein 15-like [Capsicum annuum]|nr:putative U-box domain-containing protein 15-like [Capsicum annuum]KAF3658623.1 putative U-box domain-containing protein 15-like [Capsicum annuum]